MSKVDALRALRESRYAREQQAAQSAARPMTRPVPAQPRAMAAVIAQRPQDAAPRPVESSSPVAVLDAPVVAEPAVVIELDAVEPIPDAPDAPDVDALDVVASDAVVIDLTGEDDAVSRPVETVSQPVEAPVGDAGLICEAVSPPAEVPVAAAVDADTARCGFIGKDGRTCMRDTGHPEKNHRYVERNLRQG